VTVLHLCDPLSGMGPGRSMHHRGHGTGTKAISPGEENWDLLQHKARNPVEIGEESVKHVRTLTRRSIPEVSVITGGSMYLRSLGLCF